ncbi:hypothetical protein CPB86DRAFT_792040 [Serendipita vermifera]|nr:hypothetical protein CPB86DRAFT_792040 [Serendipita vermifera]
MKRAYQSNYRTDLNTHFTVLFLKDTSIELSTLDNSFLTSNPFLFVEVSLDGKVVVKETLSLCKSSSGIWEVDEILILGETFGHFTISVTMGADGDEYQLLGLVGSNGSGLLDTTGKLQTIPLACHEKDSL